MEIISLTGEVVGDTRHHHDDQDPDHLLNIDDGQGHGLQDVIGLQVVSVMGDTSLILPTAC